MNGTERRAHDGRNPGQPEDPTPTGDRGPARTGRRRVAGGSSSDSVLLAVVAGSFLPIGLLVAAVYGGGAVIVGLAFLAEVLVTTALVAAIGRAVDRSPLRG